MDTIDIELLICMVRDRPALWDNTYETYKKKNYCREAWAEICLAFEPEYENMKFMEKIELQMTLVKKWCNIRDSWMRWKKKVNEKNKVLPYCHSEKLEFLNKVASTPRNSSRKSDSIKSAEKSKMEDSTAIEPHLSVPVHSPPSVSVPSQSSPFAPVPVPIQPHSLPMPMDLKTTKIIQEQHPQTSVSVPSQSSPFSPVPVPLQPHSLPVPVNLKPAKTIPVQHPKPSHSGILPPAKKVAADCGSTTNKSENENRHLSFFKSVLPSMACFSDDETLHFQMCVLTTIQNIKRTRRLNEYI